MNRYIRGAALLTCVVVPSAPAFPLPTPPVAFVGITPCRLADTRAGSGFGGFFGPPSMAAQSSRSFPIAGQCGIPFTAQAVSANIAVTNTSGLGFLAVWPGGDPQPSPMVASINYSAGQTIANAVLAPLGNYSPFPFFFERGITVFAKAGLDLIIDVNGYFDTGAAGPTGPTGPSGPSGPSGPPGPAGLSSIGRVTHDFTALWGINVGVHVSCPGSNPRVIGGGAQIRDKPGFPGSSNASYVPYSFPAGTGTWEVWVRTSGSIDNPATAYAICVP
jgi:hypothetical protein